MYQSADSHAVRWIRREVMGGIFVEHSKWHWTLNASHTVCNRPIVIGTDISFMPETHDNVEKVDCKQCLYKINNPLLDPKAEQ